MKSFIALIATLSCLAVSATALFEKVEHLTDGNWNSKMQSSDQSIWLISFYVPWCPHAQQFSPQLEAAAADLIKHGYRIKFGAVDVSVNRQVGAYYRIEGSPVVKMFYKQDGQWVPTDYTGGNDKSSVDSFCKDFYKQKNLPYSNLPEGYKDGEMVELDEDNFDDIVLGSNEIWLLKFAAPWCYHCNLMRPNWIAAAKEMGANVRFGLIDADANRALARRYNVQTLPLLVYMHAGYGKTDASAQPYTSGRSKAEILNFAANLHQEYLKDPSSYQHCPSSHGHASGEECDVEKQLAVSSFKADDATEGVPSEAQWLCEDGCLCIVAFLPEGNYRSQQTSALTSAANQWSDEKVRLYWVETGSNKQCEDVLNVNSYSQARVIAFTHGEDKYVTMDDDLSTDSLNYFIEQVKAQGVSGGVGQPYGGIKLADAH